MQSQNPSPNDVRSPAENPPSSIFVDVPLEDSPSSPTSSASDGSTDPDYDNSDWVEVQYHEHTHTSVQQPLHEEEGILVEDAEVEAETPEYFFDYSDSDDSRPGSSEDMPVPVFDMDTHASDLRDALIQDRLSEVQDSLDDGVWMVWLLGDERGGFLLDVFWGEWV